MMRLLALFLLLVIVSSWPIKDLNSRPKYNSGAAFSPRRLLHTGTVNSDGSWDCSSDDLDCLCGQVECSNECEGKNCIQCDRVPATVGCCEPVNNESCCGNEVRVCEDGECECVEE